MTGIRGYGYFISCQRRIETGPPSVGIKFRIRAKQLVSACATEINSFFVIVPILVLVWRLGSGTAQHLKLQRRENRSPLVVTQHHLLLLWSRSDLFSDSRGLCVVRETEMNGQNKKQKQRE